MSLRSVTDKIDGVLQSIALLLTLVMWAAFGFPFIPEVVGLGCLLVVGLLVYWLMSRYAKVK